MNDIKGQGNNKQSQAAISKSGGLLPPAKIHLFSDDLETLNLFHALGEDWRFGRVSMGIRGDNLDQAIEHYSRRKSPTLVIIQTDETGAEFEEKLGKLAELCDEATAAIVIGPVNDVQLYRHLTAIGISDYLVAPLDSENFIEAIGSSLQSIVGSVDSHLMTLVGVKGGVGTTSIAAMISDLLANHFKAKTLIIDAAGAKSTLWNHFGFSPAGTLIEAARAVVDNDKDALSRLIVKKSDTLHVLNTGTENILDNPVATQAYEMLLDHLLNIYPYVILDTSNAPIQITRLAANRSHSIAIVTTPRVADLSLTKMMMKSLRDMPGAETRTPTIILNKTNAVKSLDISDKDACELLGVEKMLNLPLNNDMFAKAENNGQPLSEQTNFENYSYSLIDFIAAATQLAHFKHEMKQKTNTGLLSIFKRFKGGK